MMDLQLTFDGGEYLTLKSVDYDPAQAVGFKSWGMYAELNAAGEVIFYDDYGDPAHWEMVFDLAIKDIEKEPPQGLYSVPDLKLENLSFLDLITALRDKYAPVAAAS